MAPDPGRSAVSPLHGTEGFNVISTRILTANCYAYLEGNDALSCGSGGVEAGVDSARNSHSVFTTDTLTVSKSHLMFFGFSHWVSENWQKDAANSKHLLLQRVSLLTGLSE